MSKKTEVRKFTVQKTNTFLNFHFIENIKNAVRKVPY